jgi:hypothetical protein
LSASHSAIGARQSPKDWLCTFMHWEEKKFDHDPRSAREFALHRGTMRLSKKSYFAVTRLCVMACTDSAIRFCTPTFRISLAT